MLLLWMVQVYVMILCFICDVALYHQKENMPVNWTPLTPHIIAASLSTAPKICVGSEVEANTYLLRGGILYCDPLPQIWCCSILSKKWIHNWLKIPLTYFRFLLLRWPPFMDITGHNKRPMLFWCLLWSYILTLGLSCAIKYHH